MLKQFSKFSNDLASQLLQLLPPESHNTKVRIKKELSTFSVCLDFIVLKDPVQAGLHHNVSQFHKPNMIFISLNHTIVNLFGEGGTTYFIVLHIFSLCNILFCCFWDIIPLLYKYLVHVIRIQIPKSHNRYWNTQVNWTSVTSTQSLSFPISSIWKHMDLCLFQ